MLNLKPYNGDPKLVVAFDIGTTFSGISYCILERNQVPEILGVTRFPGQAKVNGDAKVPSLLYYDKNGTVKAAGAEVLTESVIETALNEEWTRAEWWKLHLRPNHLASSINKDDDLPPLPIGRTAVHVLTDFIRYLFNCAKTYTEERHLALSWSSVESSIEYIFTYPNGWEVQQQLYRRAIELAGLVPSTAEGQSRVHMLTEGEANLRFCVANIINVDQTTPQGVAIIDAGGATIDLSMFSMTPNPISCEEMAPAECRLEGSVYVTRRARVLLERKLQGWDHSTPEEIAEYTREFDQSTKLVIKNDEEPAYIRVAGRRTNVAKYHISFGKLKLTGTEATGLFYGSLDAITSAFELQLKAAKASITMAFFVGGLSTNDWLWSRLQVYFKNRNINVCRPDNHINKAVANGAVLSHVYCEYYKVTSQVAHAIYGVLCAVPVKTNEEEHMRRKDRWEIDPTGERFVPDYFETKLVKGDKFSEVDIRESFSLTESDPSQFTTQKVHLKYYQGNIRNQQWVDQDPSLFFTFCTISADLNQAVNDLTKKKRPLGKTIYQLDYNVILYFGLTDLKAYLSWKTRDGERRIPANIEFFENVPSKESRQPRKARHVCQVRKHQSEPSEHEAEIALILDRNQHAECTSLRTDNDMLRRNLTSASAEIKELRQHHDAQSGELTSMKTELKAKGQLIEERDRRISSFIAQVVELQRSDTEKTRQIAAVRQECDKLRIDSVKLQDCCDSVRDDFQASKTLVEEKDRTIAMLNAYIEKSKLADAIKTEQRHAEEKEKLQRDLASLSSQLATLQVRCDVQSKEIVSYRKEARAKLTLLAEQECRIASLATERDLARRKYAMETELVANARKDAELLWQKLSISWDQNTDLQRQFDSRLIELNHLHTELSRTRLCAKGLDAGMSDDDVAAHVARVLEEKQEQMEALHQALASEISEKNDSQKSREVLLSKISALADELTIKTFQCKDAESIIASFTVQINRLSVASVDDTEQLAIALDQVRALQLEATTATAQFSELQGRYATQSKEIIYMNNQLQAMTLAIKETDRTILSLTMERDHGVSEPTDAAAQVAKLRHDPSISFSEITGYREEYEKETKELKSQVEEWKNLSTAKEKELFAARKSLEEIQDKLNVSSSRITELSLDFKTQSAKLEFLQEKFSVAPGGILTKEWEDTKMKILSEMQDYTDVIKLTALVDELVSADAKVAQELALEHGERNRENKELRQNLLALREIYIHAPRIKQIFQSGSIEIKRHDRVESKVLHEQFLLGDSEADVEWNIDNTKILSNVQDYADVIKLAATVDEWVGADAKRAQVLALQLEERSRGSEELRRKLLTLREIYIRAPRIKQIFQSNIIEIKGRYEEESKALKASLSDSQSQLRDMQRVVGTGNAYAEDTILSALKRLNGEIRQNTSYIAEHIAGDFQPGSTTLTKRQSQSISKSIGKTFANVLGSMEEEDVELYLSIAFQAFFSYYLWRVISSWTTEKEHNAFIEEIYGKLQKSETQPVSGRWRALTRTYVSPTWMDNTSSIAQEIIVELSYVVVAAGCATSVAAANSKLSSFKDKVLSIITTAGQFSEMIWKTVSADFAVVAPLPLQVFEDAIMEEDDVNDDSPEKGTPARKVLCSTQLGMAKRMEYESGSETQTVTKAKVVLESFLCD